MTASKKIWMDGEFVEWDKAKIHIMTHTFNYGLGVFEGIRCYKTKKGPAIFRYQEHLDRLFDSVKIASIKAPYTIEEFSQAIIDTIRINKLTECYIKPIFYYGYGEAGIFPKNHPVNAAISVFPWGAYLGKEGLEKGIRVKISSFQRHHINISMTKAKICGNYVNSQLAKIEAIENGYDEALMLDAQGQVAEGSGENIFIVKNGIIKTTPILSILAGITRDSVIQIAKDEGIEVKEALFSRDEIYIANEAFFTGTAAEVTPIREVDNRVIGNGMVGEITKKIQKIFFSIVKGNNKKFSKWLTYI
ncbi:MAG: branched chain amino acid aminotransferase [Candidatus Schekmanbacteria bacterium RBG_16_38_11]|uniref:Branched-chain-amino-acid aminotransferase n=1 Tax=Candidatus Schekmanbacteria bacterium RBG_16_38_11 TaxID=1817880 RepID=A0A1F7RTJ3_9BACT|nr:MAG: branched chain amino acid aminotransferase [Candidatus Schekmanbacteria bacterium RBG_16_38_11]